MNKLKRMREILPIINRYAHAYYTLGKPIVEDSTYDKLYDELLQLEKETGIILSGSITQSVGGQVLDKLKKVKHEYPLLSLDKTKDINVLRKFSKGKDGILMLKLDGLTIDNTYEDGKLIQSETRGNGEIGEDITENAKTFTNLPLTIPYKGKVHFIGEAIITFDVFEEINSKLSEDKRYKNCRNLSSGSIRQLDSNICKQRKVKFIGYIVEGLDLKTKVEQFEFMLQQGFDITDWLPYNPKEDNLELDIETMKMLAQKKQYPIDGLVMQYNDIEYGKSLGRTSHHPLHSIAFKFNEDVEITTLRNIEWQVGRTGKCTPVAEFDEVELAGTTVSRASVHNLSIVKALQLGIGDEVSTCKKNEIIPQILDNLTRSNNLKIPTYCPVCGEKLTIKKENETEELYCTNDNCKAKLVQKLTHYVSRNALNIEGLSEATIEKFIELEFIKEIKDIYNLEQYKNKIVKLDGFGTKSYNNLINSIEKSKQCKLENFLFGLGIPNVGKSTAKDICKHFENNYDLIVCSQVSDYLKIDGIGDVVAKSIVNYFNSTKTLRMVNEIYSYLTFIEDKPKETKQGVFTGKSLYCTGTFACGKKDYLKELVESNGGIFESGLKKTLNYLVIGSLKGSSKEQKAKDMGVSVISEDEFLQIIKGN